MLFTYAVPFEANAIPAGCPSLSDSVVTTAPQLGLNSTTSGTPLVPSPSGTHRLPAESTPSALIPVPTDVIVQNAGLLFLFPAANTETGDEFEVSYAETEICAFTAAGSTNRKPAAFEDATLRSSEPRATDAGEVVCGAYALPLEHAATAVIPASARTARVCRGVDMMPSSLQVATNRRSEDRAAVTAPGAAYAASWA